jgi:hypothetical protein
MKMEFFYEILDITTLGASINDVTQFLIHYDTSLSCFSAKALLLLSQNP